MTHPNLEPQLDAYLDGELAEAERRELESHLAHCPECTRFLDSRLALRSAIKARIPALRAPDTLRRRVRSLQRRARMPVLWRSLAVAASLAVVAVGGWRLGGERGGGARLADGVFTSSVREVMARPLTAMWGWCR